MRGTHVTVQGFVQSMREEPHDSANAWILADFLDDHGDPDRAEFLRTEMTLSAWVGEVGQRERLQQRSRQLLLKNQENWLGIVPFRCQSWTTYRGCVDITLTASQFLHACFQQDAEAMLRNGWVRRVKIVKVGSHELRRLAEMPSLDYVSSLDLQGNRLTDAQVFPLITSGRLSKLVELNLANNRLTTASVELLTKSELSNLREIDLRNNRIAHFHAGVTSRLEQLERLSRIELHGNDLCGRTLAEFARWQIQRECPLRVGTQPQLLTNSLGMEFVRIPAGSFRMGSPSNEPNRRDNEEPEHLVELSNDYYLGRFQVTQAQYFSVLGANPSTFRPGRRGGPHHPVENVSRLDAEEFCEALNRLESEKAAGRSYRLATEAEWEHACRAGISSVATHYGPMLSSNEANFDGGRPYNRALLGEYRQCTTIVGAFSPNAFGLYDMHGNVWEWCADSYDKSAYRRRDRVNPIVEGVRERGVLRGGSWHSDGPWCRSAYRCSDSVHSRFNWNGFRVVVVQRHPNEEGEVV